MRALGMGCCLVAAVGCVGVGIAEAKDVEANIFFSTTSAVPSGQGATFRDIRGYDYTNGHLAVNMVNNVSTAQQPLWGVYRVDGTTGAITRAADSVQVAIGTSPAVQLAGFDGTNVWINATGRNASRNPLQTLYKQTGTGAPVPFASPGSTAINDRFSFAPGKNADNGEISYRFGRGPSAAQINASGSGNLTLVPLNTNTAAGTITTMTSAIVREGNDTVFLGLNNTNFTGFGYFKHDRSNGSLTPIVTNTTQLPKRFGGTGTVSDFNGGLNNGIVFDYSGGTLSFMADIGGDFGTQGTPVFSNQNGAWERIYEPGTPAPNAAIGVMLAGPGTVAKDGDTTYIFSQSNRIYQYSDGVLMDLFGFGDTLNDGAITITGFGLGALSFHAEDDMVIVSITDAVGEEHVIGVPKADPFSAATSAGAGATAQIIGGANVHRGVNATFDMVDSAGDFTGSFEELTLEEFSAQVAGLGGDANFYVPGGASVQAWELDFTGEFSEAITLMFGYDDSDLTVDEQTLGIYHLLDDGSFEVLMGIVDDVNNTITVETTSLSPFYVGVVPEPASAALMALGGLALVRRRR